MLAASLAFAGHARADDIPVFHVDMKDGRIIPGRLEVPANKPFRLDIANLGRTPAELESTQLRREKMVAASASSALVFRRLEAGEYKFFDDFHPDGPGMILVAR
jgi:hypothetical protein